ncbi:hypothetical protein LOK49_LG13G00339 [Camellia lanceoleosa]|uniref:Uncharacterized protein n=1 Tax=Camellia lanceoleosa TaxID=1840588 RepID=A0ACC0FIJ2_9ERIC|nr:hypothetical protein LOK49_LG13G00339 [Camellia lanceoleosa]
MEEAKKNMYAFSTTTYTGFQCTVSEETSKKFKGLSGVLWVLPDSYIDVKNKDYGGDISMKKSRNAFVTKSVCETERWSRLRSKKTKTRGNSFRIYLWMRNLNFLKVSFLGTGEELPCGKC